MIRQMIMNNSGTEDDAADIFQDGMVVLFEKASDDSFELSCQLKTYLYSVCRRLWLKRLQQNGKYIQLDGMEEIVPVEDVILDHEDIQNNFSLMENAMLKLGEPCKGLLEAYYLQKKAMLDIANDFGYTNADNAKTQKYKCLLRLKKLFFSQYKTND